LFDWCTCYQAWQATDPSNPGYKWTDPYPGDDVVDIVSLDVYDEWHGGWHEVLDAPGGVGLNAFRDFARQHNKPEAYPEWGLSCSDAGKGDNEEFITNMKNWFDEGGAQVWYHAYWNTNLGGPDAAIQGPLSGNVPQGAEMYRAHFSK
jgi:hypothetical protein